MSKPFSFSSLFGGTSAAKPVNQILSGIADLISELKAAVATHNTKIAENDAQIEALKAASDASRAEIDAATNAHTNLAALIGTKPVVQEPPAPVGAE
jgi:hypothetical protein